MRIDDLRVNMLSRFEIRMNGQSIDDSGNHSKKVWLLLAYMIYCRNRTITQDELISLLWGEEERSRNPINALKTMLHRARTMLNQLGDTAGHELIVRRGGNYTWNNDIPMVLDVDDFDRFCRQGAAEQNPERRLALYLQALQLYQGDFLRKLSAESWVIPISAYFHNLFMRVVEETLPMLEERERREEANDLCRKALEIDPYNEDFYRHLMQNLLVLGDQRAAITVYEDMSKLLFSNFGVMPAEDIRALYRSAINTVNDKAIPLDEVRNQLRELDESRGALICEYDFFRVLYQAQARFIARSGDAVHICLFSIRGEGGKELPKRSLDCVMENLKERIQMNLRRGDVASQCSVSQYVIMLPQANYENSCMVCERIVKAFFRQYPHSPAKLHYSVQPLEPKL